jgi:hypothetical protein
MIMANELTEKETGGVPGWMRKASTGASLGNIDGSDLKPPRLKMLAGMSPEVMNGKPGASPGNFWMTIFEQSLGPSVTGSIILLSKKYHVWAPKGGDTKGPLATASNGISWDIPNQTFEIRYPGNSKIYKWKIGKLVTDFGATKWGTSQDDDPKSKPIATLTYDTLWLIDMPGGRKQLCVFTSARTGIKPTQNFISALGAQGVDHYFQRYRIVAQKLTGPTGDPYFSYEYQHIGNVQSEEEGKFLRGLYEQYSKTGFVVDLEGEAEDIQTARHTEGTKRDFEHHRDDEEIPF